MGITKLGVVTCTGKIAKTGKVAKHTGKIAPALGGMSPALNKRARLSDQVDNGSASPLEINTWSIDYHYESYDCIQALKTSPTMHISRQQFK